MDNVKIGVGTRIKRGNKEYRVIHATGEYVVLCEMNIERAIHKSYIFVLE